VFRAARNSVLHPVGLHFYLKTSIEMLQNKPSKKGGRPAKSLAEKRKYRLSLKLNTSEYLQLKSKSKIAGKNRCDFLRELIFSSEIKQQFSKEQNEIFRQITGMANNLNQLVKLAHVQSVWYIEVTAKKLLDDLDELLKRIKL
jgi:hypothetical protein